MTKWNFYAKIAEIPWLLQLWLKYTVAIMYYTDYIDGHTSGKLSKQQIHLANLPLSPYKL